METVGEFFEGLAKQKRDVSSSLLSIPKAFNKLRDSSKASRMGEGRRSSHEPVMALKLRNRR